MFTGVPECRAHCGVWGFATALSAASAPNVASHADDPQSMSCPGLYKRITFVVVVFVVVAAAERWTYSTAAPCLVNGRWDAARDAQSSMWCIGARCRWVMIVVTTRVCARAVLARGGRLWTSDFVV